MVTKATAINPLDATYILYSPLDDSTIYTTTSSLYKRLTEITMFAHSRDDIVQFLK